VNFQTCVTAPGSEVKNNVFLNFGGGVASGTTVGAAIISTNRATGSITDCFNSSSDHHLRTGTNPCVDAGTTVATVTTDFQGARRPQGSAYDMAPMSDPADHYRQRQKISKSNKKRIKASWLIVR
jgi:hypothetical protein